MKALLNSNLFPALVVAVVILIFVFMGLMMNGLFSRFINKKYDELNKEELDRLKALLEKQNRVIVRPKSKRDANTQKE